MTTNVPDSTANLIEEYIRDARLQGLTEETVDTYESNLTYTFEYLNCSPENVGKNELKALLHHLRNEKDGRRGRTDGLSHQTITGYFSALNSLYKYLIYEEYIDANPVPPFRERYVKKQSGENTEERQLISVSEMSGLVISIMDTRDKAVLLVLAKTGVRRGELVEVDTTDIDWEKQSIKLKQTPKRSNRVVFFDDECARVLEQWLDIRDREDTDTDALFVNQRGERLQRNGIYSLVTNHAKSVGLHDPNSNELDDRFTPHCCRHWFTTHLRRSGMAREYIKELRGDEREVDSMETYNHIDRDDLREAYLTHIPKLNI